jgi:hypothetical protein
MHSRSYSWYKQEEAIEFRHSVVLEQLCVRIKRQQARQGIVLNGPKTQSASNVCSFDGFHLSSRQLDMRHSSILQ